MPEIPGEAREMLRRTVRRFVRREIWLWEKRIDPNAFALPPEVALELRARVSKMGLALVRHDLDGDCRAECLDATGRVDVVEEISQHRAGLLAPGYGLFGPEVPPALQAADADQRARFLEPLLTGDLQCFIGLHDPWPEVAPAVQESAPGIRARRTQDGWMLDGTKIFVAGAGSAEGGADFGLVYARTESEAGERLGVSCFLVEMDRPGVQRWRPYPTLAVGRDTQELNLSNVRLPGENLLGEVSEGLTLAPGAHARRDLFVAAGAVGVGRAALAIVSDRPRSVTTDGGRWAVTDAEATLASAGALVREAAGPAWAVGVEAGPGECATAAPPRRESAQDAGAIAAVARARLAALDASAHAVDGAITALGPAGLSADLPLERWFRELRVVRESDGGPARLRENANRRPYRAEGD